MAAPPPLVRDLPERPASKVEITNDAWHACIRAAWARYRKDAPTPAALRLMWAMWALETANGKAMWNGNFGNMMPDAASSQYANGWIYLNTSAGKLKFAAYPTSQAGAYDWLRYFNRPSYGPDAVFAAFQAGDAAGLAHLLKIRNYYGDGSEDDYRNGLIARAKQYTPSTARPATTGDGGGAAFGAGAALLAAILLGRARKA